jgi:hypothetical protein
MVQFSMVAPSLRCLVVSSSTLAFAPQRTLRSRSTFVSSSSARVMPASTISRNNPNTGLSTNLFDRFTRGAKTMFLTRTPWGKEPPDTERRSFEDAVSETQSKAEIAIFWDYENMEVPDWCSAAKASECIRKNVQSRGRIIERKLYFDSSKTTQHSLERSVLDPIGFSLVDCPTRNKKETVDKKIIVDMLCFAYERVFSKGSNVNIVLITSDGDYAYTLARLRGIGVTTVVIYSPDRVADILISSAGEAVTWEDDILGGTPRSQRSNFRDPVTDRRRTRVRNATKSNTTEAPTTTATKPLDNKNTILLELRSYRTGATSF